MVDDGYEFFADRKLVTVFSAPNYCGEFDNAASILSVDESLCCKFHKFQPVNKKKRASLRLGEKRLGEKTRTPSPFLRP